MIIDINALMLYGNEYAILNRIAQWVVKSMFKVPHLSNLRVTPINPQKENDGEFIISDYHMEFELTEKALEYIKSIIKNKTISSRSFVFIIKNAEPSLNRNLYLALRRMIDMNSSSKFIITTSSVSFMEKSLLSRVLQVNCTFPFEKVKSCDIVINACKDMAVEKLKHVYTESHSNIITLLQHLSSKCETLLWQQSIEHLMKIMKEEKKHLVIIMSIRELVYKLYHVGVGLKDICKYVIQHHAQQKNFHDIVHLAASCDHGITQGNKDILLYEKFFLKLYKLL